MYPESVTFAPRQARTNRLTLVLLWIVFYCSFTLFTPPLLDDADSVHAEVAREMLLRHDFVTLYANGIRYLEKAPLFYWSEALSMKLFGSSTAASRLSLALTILALTLLLESFARRAFAQSDLTPNTRAGLYAGLITLSSFGIFIFSRINIPDLLVCVLLTAALSAFWTTEQHSHRTMKQHTPKLCGGSATESTVSLLPCSLFAAACALNLLTKGLIGIVFPLAIVLSYLLFTRGLRATLTRLRQLHPLAASLVFLVLAVPWHILIAHANPTQGRPGGLTFTHAHWQVPLPTPGNVHGWTWFYFVNEQLLRYLNLRVPRDYDTVPLWLFLGLIFIWLMPWSAFLPSAFAHTLPLRTPAFRQRLRTHTLTPAERTNLLLLIWAVLPLAFFSLSTRQEYYVLPALPPMILLIASRLSQNSKLTVATQSSAYPREEASETREHLQATHFAPEAPRGPFNLRVDDRDTTVATLLLILGTLLSTACLVFLLHTRPPAPDTALASLLQQNPGDYALSFGHFLDLNAQALGLFRFPLTLTALALFLGPLAHYLLRRRALPHAATLALASSTFLFLLAAWLGLRTFSPTLTSYQLAEAIRPQLHPSDMVAIYGEYEAGSTLGFYLRRNDLHILEGRSSNLWYGSFFPDAPPLFETRQSIAARWPRPQRIFLWQDPSDRERPPLTLPGPTYLIASSGGKQIVSNQPSR